MTNISKTIAVCCLDYKCALKTYKCSTVMPPLTRKRKRDDQIEERHLSVKLVKNCPLLPDFERLIKKHKIKNFSKFAISEAAKMGKLEIVKHLRRTKPRVNTACGYLPLRRAPSGVATFEKKSSIPTLLLIA